MTSDWDGLALARMILEPDWFKIDIGLTSDLHGIGAGLAPDTADGPWIDADWHRIGAGLAPYWHKIGIG